MNPLSKTDADAGADTAIGGDAAVPAPLLELILITGLSGSGKSVALDALEDAAFYCVDNLPPDLLLPFVALEQRNGAQRVAVAMDARSAAALPLVPQHLAVLRAQGVSVRLLFLDASTDTLVRRYSETRRRHPLSQRDVADQQLALVQAIELERELLGDLREQAHVIDSSLMLRAQLQRYVKTFISAPADALLLVFESFAFKRGTPVDADFIFDVRMLPNPHYHAELRPLTGRDEAVAAFLRGQPEAERMFQDIAGFVGGWLEAMSRDHRSYVTVGVGCTGGQHRSVYLVERLAEFFGGRWTTLKRHREID